MKNWNVSQLYIWVCLKKNTDCVDLESQSQESEDSNSDSSERSEDSGIESSGETE